MFDRVFPDVLRAIGAAAPAAEVHEAALRLLFRLLFLFYAEDRDLLTVRQPGRAAHGLHALRVAAARMVDRGRLPASGAAAWWPRLTALLSAAAQGDAAPGRFDDTAAPVLPDVVLVPVLDALSRVPVDGERRWIDYRGLSVQLLGSLYERLLGRADGQRPDASARRAGGSYYTPDDLVRLILRRTVGPLLAERRDAFRQRAEALAGDRRPLATRLRELRALDPAAAFVALSVCDPAMGSGHFLVALADALTEAVLTEIATAPEAVTWAPYRSPLFARIAALRARLRARAAAKGWTVRAAQLDDRHLVRRIVLGHVVHGVDRDPMAVALARLSLWLHCGMAGVPLSFLNRRLRCGDALFGEFAAGEATAGSLDLRHARRWLPPPDRGATPAWLAEARALAKERRWLHWELEFPHVWRGPNAPGGFDAVIGNPPWDRMKMQEVEWFAARVPEVALAPRAADRKRRIAALRRAGAAVAAEYDGAAGLAATAARVARECGAFPLLSAGDVNLYALFVERAARLVRAEGIVGLLVPSGIAADKGAAAFFRAVSTTGRLAALLDFENRRPGRHLEPFFPDVDGRFKFSALVFGGVARRFPRADCAFFQHDAAAAEAQALALTPADFAAVNPNTGTAPMFRNPGDAAITLGIYRRLPVLVDRRCDPPARAWPVRYVRMFDMTLDSALFRTAAELRAAGARRSGDGCWRRGRLRWLPLYEGKMVQAYDHRAASVVVRSRNVKRPAQPEAATDAQHADPAWLPAPRFWVAQADVERRAEPQWAVGYKLITAPSNARTFIAAILPPCGAGNSLGLMLPGEGGDPALIVANLNAFVFDFVCRQKIQGQNLNWYMVEQLPVVPPDGFARRFGARTAAAIVREDVLHLTCTAHDMAGFARTLGHDGPPFAWDAEDRVRRRARLDAVFFHLYGLDRAAAATVLDTFPQVRREEYRAKDLILGYMAALAAGHPDAPVAGQAFTTIP